MVIVFSVIASSLSYARWHIDIETGVVLPGYNDVRIPNETGTLFSLTDELETDPKPFFRTKVIYSINNRHSIAMLVAPLRLQAQGQVNRPVRFEEEEFPAHTSLKGKYRFASVRRPPCGIPATIASTLSTRGNTPKWCTATTFLRRIARHYRGFMNRSKRPSAINSASMTTATVS